MAQKLKLSKDEFNPDELDVEIEDNDYDDYTGPPPPNNTMLIFRIKKMWWTYTQPDADKNEFPMIKAIVTAEQGSDDDDTAQYDGLTIWDNLTFKASAAFRYQPFLEAIGVTLKDIFGKLYVADDDDNVGAPIERIGTWVPGSDDAVIMGVTKREKYNGEWSTKIKKYLAYEAPDEPEPDEDETPPPRTRRAGAAPKRRSSVAEDTADEDADEPDEHEDDETEPEPPARTRRAPARTAKAAASKAPTGRRGGRRAAEGDDEPPF